MDLTILVTKEWSGSPIFFSKGNTVRFNAPCRRQSGVGVDNLLIHQDSTPAQM